MKIVFLSLVFLSSMALAQKSQPNISYSMPAIEGGFKWNSADLTGASSNKQEIGYQFGVSAVFNFAASFGLKSGMFYSERPFKAEYPSGATGKGKITYFEVPALFMFKFEEYAGIYAGASAAVKLSDENSGGALTNVKTLVVPLTFGAQFKFLPYLGANVFFETVPGELATGIENSKAVGVNLLFTLD